MDDAQRKRDLDTLERIRSQAHEALAGLIDAQMDASDRGLIELVTAIEPVISVVRTLSDTVIAQAIIERMPERRIIEQPDLDTLLRRYRKG